MVATSHYERIYSEFGTVQDTVRVLYVQCLYIRVDITL